MKRRLPFMLMALYTGVAGIAAAQDGAVYAWLDPDQPAAQWPGGDLPVVPVDTLRLDDYRRDAYDQLVPELRLAYRLRGLPAVAPGARVEGRTPEGWPVEVEATGYRIRDTAHGVVVWMQLEPSDQAVFTFPSGVEVTFLPGRDGRVRVVMPQGKGARNGMVANRSLEPQVLARDHSGLFFEQHSPGCQSALDQRAWRIGNTEIVVEGTLYGNTRLAKVATGLFQNDLGPARCRVRVGRHFPKGTDPNAEPSTRSYYLRGGEIAVVFMSSEKGRGKGHSGSREFFLYPSQTDVGPDTQLNIQLLAEGKFQIQMSEGDTWIFDAATSELVGTRRWVVESRPLSTSAAEIAKQGGGWMLYPKLAGSLVLDSGWYPGSHSPSLREKATVWAAEKKRCEIKKNGFYKIRYRGNDDLEPISRSLSDLSKYVQLHCVPGQLN